MSNFNPYLVFPITFITLGHIALALEVPLVGIQAVWDPTLRACTEDPNLSIGAASEFVFYTYTVVWDLSILLLTCAELYRQRSVWDAPIGVVLRRQGFIYMSVTCITNITSLNVMPQLIIGTNNAGGAIK
ncbi:hypothetical protein PHLCEN_2v2357 [Hermanssonia centrifuga]|uniref:Uncharacterized protein n=1 Tax=Hermanssonia centrifuga TaxID=98765 RepID=A0A2R6RM42_9APHY|nr:hypothetical protein PHLCEN_2v2357 [Hermanssonia centrifuga]